MCGTEIELLSWWPNVKCGLQIRGLTDSTGNENCFDYILANVERTISIK